MVQGLVSAFGFALLGFGYLSFAFRASASWGFAFGVVWGLRVLDS